MLIELNNGVQIDLPLITQGEIPNQNLTIYRYTYPAYYYERTSGSYAQFGVLNDYLDQVDALNNPVDSVSYIYTITHALYDYRHPEEYFTTGTGKTYIDYLREHTVWVMGSFDEGGFGIFKVGNKYGFLDYAGYYQADDQSDGFRLFYRATAYVYEGEDRGVYTRSQLQSSTLTWLHDKDADYPPISIFMPNESANPFAVQGFIDDPMGPTKYANWVQMPIEGAMGDGSYFAADLGLIYLPTRPWIGTDTVDICGTQVAPNEVKISGTPYGGADIDPDSNPYAEGGTATTGGGNGSFDNSCDTNPATGSGQFTIDAINSGFLTLYNPSKSEIQDFNDFLFSGITEDMSAVLKRLISSPLDYVLFISMCHFQPNTSSRGIIKFCGLDSGVTSNVIGHQMQEIDCGTLTLNEDAETKSFLSYNPYFRISAYLPYIGIINLDPDLVMDGSIHLVYWVDLCTGSCIAQLEVNRNSRQVGDPTLKPNVVMEYQGNCFLNLPLSATDWRGLFQSVVQFAGGALGAATGNAAGLGTIASAVTAEKYHAVHSGQMGTNYGYMGKQVPYLILERPILQTPQEFGSYEGYPSNLYRKLSEVSGYTELDPDTLWIGTYTDPMDGITEAEADMIRECFNNGVYVNWNGNEG